MNTPTQDERSEDGVGLLTLYSNLSDQGKRLHKLLELPHRPDESPRSAPDGRRRPTAAERAEFVDGYRTGETIRQLAMRFGFHRETVSIALKRVGVARRHHQRREVDLALADELHSTGLTITAVAARLGIGRTTLVKARRARSQAT